MESQNKLYMILACILSWILPKKKSVYFSSFFGQYNDNPKQISETLHNVAPDIPIFWTKSKRSNIKFPDYVKTIDITSFKHYIMMYTSMVTVDNQFGIRSIYANSKPLIKRIVCSLLTRKINSQLNIGTWHGTPLKKIGNDINSISNEQRLYSSIEYTIAGCTHTKDCLSSAYPNEKIMSYGTPRNDVFFKSYNVEKIKKQLILPEDKKILLFAPTFRESIEVSGPMQLRIIDWNRILRLLSQKYGGEWCVVTRFHPHVLESIDIKNKEFFINGNYGDDMADYLLIADALITDYSSSLFDYSITKKPCFLFVPDLEYYRDKERGLYLDFNNLPFPMAKTPDELYNSINNFNEKQYTENITLFLRRIGDFEDGKASERIVEDIINFLKKKHR